MIAHPRSRQARLWADERRMWKKRGWLEPHVVLVVAHPSIGLVGVATTRPEDRLLRRAEAGGVVRSRVLTENHFSARLIVAEVLTQVDAWRFIPGAMPWGDLRRTWLWLDGIDADLTSAQELARVSH